MLVKHAHQDLLSIQKNFYDVYEKINIYIIDYHGDNICKWERLCTERSSF